MEMLNQKQKIIVIILIFVVIIVIGYYYINATKDIYGSSFQSDENNALEIDQADTKEDKIEEKIIVHVTGAVEKEGVVEVKEKARINDVIEAAGGITKYADLSLVNLAYIVEDGQKIYIPSKNDTNENSENNKQEKNIVSEASGTGVIQEEDQKQGKNVNINKATLVELMTLPGIGESTASKIIEYRKINGKFNAIEDLKKVSGIGDAKFNTIKSLIHV